jgi:hypothetical protein
MGRKREGKGLASCRNKSNVCVCPEKDGIA